MGNTSNKMVNIILPGGNVFPGKRKIALKRKHFAKEIFVLPMPNMLSPYHENFRTCDITSTQAITFCLGENFMSYAGNMLSHSEKFSSCGSKFFKISLNPRTNVFYRPKVVNFSLMAITFCPGIVVPPWTRWL